MGRRGVENKEWMKMKEKSKSVEMTGTLARPFLSSAHPPLPPTSSFSPSFLSLYNISSAFHPSSSTSLSPYPISSPSTPPLSHLIPSSSSPLLSSSSPLYHDPSFLLFTHSPHLLQGYCITRFPSILTVSASLSPRQDSTLKCLVVRTSSLV